MKRARRLSIAASVCGSLVLTMVCVGNARAQTPVPEAVVRVELDAYIRSPESVAQIANFIATVPPRETTIGTDETVSSVVLREYGFGQSNLPEHYQEIIQQIVDLNELSSADIVQPGTLVIPNLPNRSAPSPEFPNSEIAALATLWFQPADSGTSSVARDPGDLRTEILTNTTRLSAESTSVYIVVPVGHLNTAVGREFLARNNTEIVSIPLEVEHRLAVHDDSASTILAAEERDQIADWLNRADHDVPLFILEAGGWPTQESLDESWEYLTRVLDTVRHAYGLPIQTLKKPVFKPGGLHAVQVESALEEFRQLDPNSRIKIIYVPMTTAQDARALLEEIATLNYLMVQHNATGFTLDIHSQAAKELARRAVGQVQGFLSGNFTLSTSAVLNGLIRIAAYSRTQDEPFYFLNQSWSVAGNVLEFASYSDVRGITVAAVGNNNRWIIRDQVDFAQRSLRDSSFVAVMNLDRTGAPLCDSSLVDNDPLVMSSIAAVGYDGRIEQGCGSSFSAPRVAWLLALAEAGRRRTVPNGLMWAAAIRKQLLDTRPSGSGLSTLVFDETEFLSSWLSHWGVPD